MKSSHPSADFPSLFSQEELVAHPDSLKTLFLGYTHYFHDVTWLLTQKMMELLALRSGWANAQHIEKTLRIQKRAFRLGKQVHLGEVFLETYLLEEEQVYSLLQLLGQKIFQISENRTCKVHFFPNDAKNLSWGKNWSEVIPDQEKLIQSMRINFLWPKIIEKKSLQAHGNFLFLNLDTHASLDIVALEKEIITVLDTFRYWLYKTRQEYNLPISENWLSPGSTKNHIHVTRAIETRLLSLDIAKEEDISEGKSITYWSQLFCGYLQHLQELFWLLSQRVFAKLSLTTGYITPPQMEEAIDVQHRALRTNKQYHLGEILLNMYLLQEEQVWTVLAQMDQEILFEPKANCYYHFSKSSFSPSSFGPDVKLRQICLDRDLLLHFLRSSFSQPLFLPPQNQKQVDNFSFFCKRFQYTPEYSLSSRDISRAISSYLQKNQEDSFSEKKKEELNGSEKELLKETPEQATEIPKIEKTTKENLSEQEGQQEDFQQNVPSSPLVEAVSIKNIEEPGYEVAEESGYGAAEESGYEVAEASELSEVFEAMETPSREFPKESDKIEFDIFQNSFKNSEEKTASLEKEEKEGEEHSNSSEEESWDTQLENVFNESQDSSEVGLEKNSPNVQTEKRKSTFFQKVRKTLSFPGISRSSEHSKEALMAEPAIEDIPFFSKGFKKRQETMSLAAMPLSQEEKENQEAEEELSEQAEQTDHSVDHLVDHSPEKSSPEDLQESEVLGASDIIRIDRFMESMDKIDSNTSEEEIYDSLKRDEDKKKKKKKTSFFEAFQSKPALDEANIVRQLTEEVALGESGSHKKQTGTQLYENLAYNDDSVKAYFDYLKLQKIVVAGMFLVSFAALIYLLVQPYFKKNNERLPLKSSNNKSQLVVKTPVVEEENTEPEDKKLVSFPINEENIMVVEASEKQTSQLKKRLSKTSENVNNISKTLLDLARDNRIENSDVSILQDLYANHNDNRRLRLSVIWSNGTIKSEESRVWLESILENSVEFVDRIAAVESLEKIADSKSKDTLLRVMQQETSPKIIIPLAYALARIAPEDIVIQENLVAKFHQSTFDKTRRSLIGAMSIIHTPEQLNFFVRVAQSNQYQASVRIEAIGGLMVESAKEMPSIANELTILQNDENSLIQEKALEAVDFLSSE